MAAPYLKRRNLRPKNVSTISCLCKAIFSILVLQRNVYLRKDEIWREEDFNNKATINCKKARMIIHLEITMESTIEFWKVQVETN